MHHSLVDGVSGNLLRWQVATVPQLLPAFGKLLRASLPHMQRVAVFTGEAFDELERLLVRPAKKPRARRKPAA